MNIPKGASCPVSTDCSETYGTLPPCAGLAVPYVPFQQSGEAQYDQTEALAHGTLYPALNLPFRLKAAPGKLTETPMTQLQALDFVLLELGHYLDTHPEDKEAFALFQRYTAMEKSARAAYEAAYGPLTKSAAAEDTTYRWLQEPWPWSYPTNEGSPHVYL